MSRPTAVVPWHCDPVPPQVSSSGAFSPRAASGAVCGLWQLSHPLVATVAYPVCAPCVSVYALVDVMWVLGFAAQYC